MGRFLWLVFVNIKMKFGDQEKTGVSVDSLTDCGKLSSISQIVGQFI